MNFEGVSEPSFQYLYIRLDFHDLDFVEAPGAPDPRKSGFGCLDFVGLKVSCSNAMLLVL